MRKLTSLAATAALAAGFVGLAAAPASASPENGNYSSCRIGVTDVSWGGKDPRDCQNYTIFHDFVPVLGIHRGSETGAWDRLALGYRATQDWCSDNSATCAIVTSVGVAIVTPLISSANS